MTDLIASIYELLSLYSTDLAEHLRGWNVRCKAYDGGVFYTTIFFVSILLSILASFLYYKRLDRPKWANHLSWIISGVIPCTIVSIWAFVKVNNDVNSKQYCKELVITHSSIWGWAFTVFLLTFVMYFAFSLFLRSLSTNCKKIPF